MGSRASWSICGKSTSHVCSLFAIVSRADNGNRQAEKEEAAADKEDGKKRKGGVHVPEEWPWEEAKKIFAEPDVTPADQIQVRRLCTLLPSNDLVN